MHLAARFREAEQRRIQSRRWRMKRLTHLQTKRRKRRKTVMKTTAQRQRTLVNIPALNAEHCSSEPWCRADGSSCLCADYSASLGSEEESGKDWDELEEEARKGLCLFA